MKFTVLLILVPNLIFAQMNIFVEAFRADDGRRVIEYFDRLSDEKNPISDDELSELIDFEREAYAIFYKFWELNMSNWHQLERARYENGKKQILIENWFKYRSEEEFDKAAIKSNNMSFDRDSVISNYLIVQGQMTVQIYSSLGDNDIRTRSFISNNEINDFRPDISSYGEKIIYSNASLSRELNDFVQNRELTKKELKFYTWEQEKDLSLKKVYFLRKNNIRVYNGHFSGGGRDTWYFTKQPIISIIKFNKDLSRAIICSSSSVGLSDQLYRRTGNTWEYVKELGSASF